MLRVILDGRTEWELYRTEEADAAEAAAVSSSGAVYSWISYGDSNWLERGWHWVNVLGLVVLPQGLPATISLPDDAPA
ncbi:MAG: hypothetical protein JW909_03650 [Planctomycetes bacterium]|nr:hypothetical protein [Planctomycetota bacterium]